jgi:hypothetical protein
MLKILIMETSFTPVDFDFKELILDNVRIGRAGKVFYFNRQNVFDCAEGKILDMRDEPGKGIFVVMEPGVEIRIDRIITLFGKPGPAYDEYDRYGNVCFECTGGYDL